MKIKTLTCFTVALGMLIVTGCERPATSGDKTPPEITVYVSRARGRNYYRTIDGVLGAPDNCIFVQQMPTQLIMIASDAGGLQLAQIKAFPATIIPESVDVTPRPPEGSHSIRTETSADTLLIRMTPPSPTTVRTGATATFEINGTLPIAITASALDLAGNPVNLAQFDIRAPDGFIQCRGQ